MAQRSATYCSLTPLPGKENDLLSRKSHMKHRGILEIRLERGCCQNNTCSFASDCRPRSHEFLEEAAAVKCATTWLLGGYFLRSVKHLDKDDGIALVMLSDRFTNPTAHCDNS